MIKQMFLMMAGARLNPTLSSRVGLSLHGLAVLERSCLVAQIECSSFAAALGDTWSSSLLIGPAAEEPDPGGNQDQDC